MSTTIKKEIMAINVNRVYQTVLSILNKEQRGYLTPSEFNNLAQQAQIEILDNLFYDYNKFLNLENINRTNEGYADLAEKIEEQIDVHYKSSDITLTNAIGTLPTDLYRIIDATITNGTVTLEKVDKKRLAYLKSSPLTKPSTSFPVYYQRSNDIIVEPALTDNSWTLGDIKLQYIQKPDDPRFGYSVDSTYGTQIYDSNIFVASGLIIKTNTLTSIAANLTGATNNTYTNISPTGGGGSGAKLTVTVAGGVISAIEVTSAGSGYTANSQLSIPKASLGGGSGATNVLININATDLYSGNTFGSTNFTLHESLEPGLILSILAYAGLIIKDPAVIQAATQLNTATNISKSRQ